MGWDGEVKGGWVSEAVTRDFTNHTEMMKNDGWWKWRT